ncbi:MAG: 30S ribosomal protein S8e [Candidatus Aenigmatarchaeota archaeon]
MALTQFRSRVKKTGGRYKKFRKKKKRNFGRDFIPIKIGENRKKFVRSLGGSKKQVILQTNKINVTDPKTGKTQLTKIITVKDNPANPHFVRMNIISKGAIVETELGLVKITSRPGQNGIVNGILIEKK